MGQHGAEEGQNPRLWAGVFPFGEPRGLMLGERCLACGGLVSPSAAWANLPGAPPLDPRPALGHRMGCPWEGEGDSET